MQDDKIIDRRKFFKLSLVAGTGLIAASKLSPLQAAQGHNHSHSMPNKASNTSQESFARGRMCIEKDVDWATLNAACECIYPKDENPGAIELKVPYFIDNQLASAYGYNVREYMQGPFINGKAEQGYQSPMYRRDIMLLGLSELENTAQKRHKKAFASCSNKEQIAILKDFEANKVKLDGISSSYFFSLLRSLTIAGVLSDPIYAGNQNKNGWRAMNYPGAQMSYLAEISGDEFFTGEPLGLADMQ